MAASAKRKQEEKHLKMLREMTSLPPNRKCFDCDQRGPTYANMTVGSFVCTSCSDITSAEIHLSFIFVLWL
uniref:Arf-GAP domain-containing protein n=1 Tax=Xiphophorus couchianus TaxID=32473 RepID=A0A3B5LYV2_9TELE